MDVGCLECGEVTEVVGLHQSVDEAKAAVDDRDEWSDPRGDDGYFPTGSQSVYVIVDLDLVPPEVVAVARWRYKETS